jgi:hypothetical protein
MTALFIKKKKTFFGGGGLPGGSSYHLNKDSVVQKVSVFRKLQMAETGIKQEILRKRLEREEK